MRFVEQTLLGAPGGNCVAASVASVLDMEITDVPDFRPEGIVARFGKPQLDPDVLWDPQDWAMAQWLTPLGYTVRSAGPWPDEHHWAWKLDLSGLVLAAAWSKRHEGYAHQVVLLDGALYWDPHPQRHMGIGPIFGFTVIERDGRRLYPATRGGGAGAAPGTGGDHGA